MSNLKKAKAKSKKEPKVSKATVRSTGGPGFDFEDQSAAWLMVKMLRGIVMPGIEVHGTSLLMQVRNAGWEGIDDILIEAELENSEQRQLAISCKSNVQVSANGLPAGFVKASWSLWRNSKKFKRNQDCLMLITRGSHKAFMPTWSDIKNWCDGGNASTAVSQIKASKKHKKIFDSIKSLDKKSLSSDEDTIALIKHLEVIPLDFQLAHSEVKHQSVAYCRELLQGGDKKVASTLWEYLIKRASAVRMAGGSLNLNDLWGELSLEFDLKDHHDFSPSWGSLSRITKDHLSIIETALPTGHVINRTKIEEEIKNLILENLTVVVYGSSGSGKSALVKSLLDKNFPYWRQVWFSPEALDQASAEKTRAGIGISQPISEVLRSTVSERNVIVIDAAERLNPECALRTKRLLLDLNTKNSETNTGPIWNVIVVGQVEAWTGGKLQALVGECLTKSIEVQEAKPEEVREALRTSKNLAWLATHDDAVKALTNLRTLAWVIEAEQLFKSQSDEVMSIPAIADRLWAYWTNDKTKLQALLIKMAEREAQFERSFAISELGLEFSGALDESPKQFPLRLNKKTNRVEFQHDLAADWARFQHLKSLKHSIELWAPFASNPLWHNALRMLGQLLLREGSNTNTAWDLAFERAENAKETHVLVADILLDALCLDPLAEQLLNERVELLLKDNGSRINRLLKRFQHTATMPGVPEALRHVDPSLQLYLEAQHRTPIYGRWPQMARFLAAHKEKIAELASPIVAKICEIWLTCTPLRLSSGEAMPYRKEFAELAVATARALQVLQGNGVIFLDKLEKPVYMAAFAATYDLPEEVAEWALEMAQRRPIRQDVADAIKKFRAERRKKEAERLRTDSAHRKRIKELRSIPSFISASRELPPWPLGPQGRVEKDFRDACLDSQALVRLMAEKPLIAKEILLATIIEDSPKEDYSERMRLDESLGLEFDNSGYPTAYWKSAFFTFLQINSTLALDALMTLISFCMERWEGDGDSVPTFEVELSHGQRKIYKGDINVFCWSQENSLHNGQLHSALAALERWMQIQIDGGIDVAPVITQLLERTNSLSVLGVLISIGKYKRELFSSVLLPLLTVHEFYIADESRVDNGRFGFDGLAWHRAGERIYEMAREWTFASYRKVTLEEIAVDLIKGNEKVADYLKAAIAKWERPENLKNAIEQRVLAAQLDRRNYCMKFNADDGAEILEFIFPAELQGEITEFQRPNQPKLQALNLPYQCEQIIAGTILLTDKQAEHLASLLDEIPQHEEIDKQFTIKAAIAATLAVKADAWLKKNSAIASQVDDIFFESISRIGDSLKELQSHSKLMGDQSLRFTSIALSHRWIVTGEAGCQLDKLILKILTSRDNQAVFILMEASYRNRAQLKHRWWRLLYLCTLWAGLSQLAPWWSEDKQVILQWERWLRWLRSCPLNEKASFESIDPLAIAKRIYRLEQARNRRQKNKWRAKLNRQGFAGLDSYVLKTTFSWLLSNESKETIEGKHECFLVQKIWEFEVWNKYEDKDDESDSDDRESPPSELGYEVIRKLSKILASSQPVDASSIWRPVLSIGVDGQYAIGHFIDSWFLEHMGQNSYGSFEYHWRAMLEFALSADNWSPNRYWYKGQQLFRQLLGFNSGFFKTYQGDGQLIIRMKDLFECWASKHLHRDEDNVTAFSIFLTSNVGKPIRLDGLLWIQAAIIHPDFYTGRREYTESSLIELLDSIVSEDAAVVSTNKKIRDALLAIAARLASKQSSAALALQDRIRNVR